jgi:transcriptional regulator with XRE-family HTH domain
MTKRGGMVSSVMGSNVRALRLAQNLSQEELAFRSELDRTYISQIERGIGNPSVLVLSKIANALGVEVQVQVLLMKR